MNQSNGTPTDDCFHALERAEARVREAKDLLGEDLEECYFPHLCAIHKVEDRCWYCRVKVWLKESTNDRP